MGHQAKRVSEVQSARRCLEGAGCRSHKQAVEHAESEYSALLQRVVCSSRRKVRCRMRNRWKRPPGCCPARKETIGRISEAYRHRRSNPARIQDSGNKAAWKSSCHRWTVLRPRPQNVGLRCANPTDSSWLQNGLSEMTRRISRRFAFHIS